MSIQFYCEGCGGNRSLFEEITVDVIVVTKFFVDDIGELHRDEQTNEEGFTERYQCSVCGWIMRDKAGEPITDEDEFLDWLEENKRKDNRYCPAFANSPTPCPLTHEECQDQHIHHAKEEDEAKPPQTRF